MLVVVLVAIYVYLFITVPSSFVIAVTSLDAPFPYNSKPSIEKNGALLILVFAPLASGPFTHLLTLLSKLLNPTQEPLCT